MEDSALSAVKIKEMQIPKLVAIVGPTAVGKSSLALDLARRFQGEIISADSMQIYHGLDVGTAKPSMEERRLIRHHLIDILDPDQDYSAALFRQQADTIVGEMHERKTPIFVVGGTGLYFKALNRGLFRGPAGNPKLRLAFQKIAEKEGNDFLHAELQRIDPEAAARIPPRDTLRIMRALEVFIMTRTPISRFHKEHRFQERPYRMLKIGLWCPREELYRRIESRVDRMMEIGWVDEVRFLLSRGYAFSLKPLQSLGYKQISSYLSEEMPLEETVRLIKQSTRRYAKRQLTWFKADPEISWFSQDQENYQIIERFVKEFLGRDSPS